MADLDDVRATFDQLTGAFNTLNLSDALSHLHDEVIFFSPALPFPTEGKAAIEPILQHLFADHESLSFTLFSPQYRMIGAMGLAWGQYTLMRKPKGGSMRATHGRYTWVFTKSNGKWLAIVAHNSRLP
jgi:ketosteroid isomerase-like protein